MKVTVKKKDSSTSVAIHTEFIKLEAALKLANAVSSGGEAKNLILDGYAKVNGEVCTMRGKKLYPGDKVEFLNRKFTIVSNES